MAMGAIRTLVGAMVFFPLRRMGLRSACIVTALGWQFRQVVWVHWSRDREGLDAIVLLNDLPKDLDIVLWGRCCHASGVVACMSSDSLGVPYALPLRTSFGERHGSSPALNPPRNYFILPLWVYGC
jgi:hypothetical protein